jgi:hypothetical protein
MEGPMMDRESPEDLLDAAYAFSRAGDFTAAVARARAAEALLPSLRARPQATERAGEVEDAVERFEVQAAVWRDAVEARGAAYTAREAALTKGH